MSEEITFKLERKGNNFNIYSDNIYRSFFEIDSSKNDVLADIYFSWTVDSVIINAFKDWLDKNIDVKKLINNYLKNIWGNKKEINNLFFVLLGGNEYFDHLAHGLPSEPNGDYFIQKYLVDDLPPVSESAISYVLLYVYDVIVALENKDDIIALAVQNKDILIKEKDILSIDAYINWVRNLNQSKVNIFVKNIWENYHLELMEKNKDKIIKDTIDMAKVLSSQKDLFIKKKKEIWRKS